MGRRCAIKRCYNRTNKPKDKVHLFPSENTNATKRALWEDFATEASQGSTGIKIYTNYGICSKHFTSDDYETECGKDATKLKEDAIPTIGLDDGKTEAEEMAEWKKKVEELQNVNSLQRSEIRSLRKQVDSLTKTVSELESKLKNEEESIKNVMSRFTSGQQKRLLSPNRTPNWNHDDIIRGLELYCLSGKAYNLVKGKWGIPLPCETTLKNHFQNLNIQPDVPFPSVLSMINAQYIDLPGDSLQAQCILGIDEININPCYVYDSALDQIFGGKKNITVFCARGLFKKWKQPIMYSFDPGLEEVDRVIRELYENGLFVVGIVSDMGPKNQRLWKTLGIGKVKNRAVENVSFLSNTLQRTVYWFPDIIHLVKLLRNHVLDSKITLEDGIVIDRTWFEELIKIQEKQELQLTNKLGYKNVYLKGHQRQNVSSAFQLFSRHVSQAIRILLSHRPGFNEVADFIDFLNDFFDMMNTRIPEENVNDYQCPFGMRFQQQNALLQKAMHIFTTMKVGGRKNALAPFQKGLIMNITSTLQLYGCLKEKYGNFKYILMNRLNQDFLENLFSVIRSFGGFKSHPNAVELKYRLRKLATQWYLFDGNDRCPENRFTTLMRTLPSSLFMNQENQEDEAMEYSEGTTELLDAVDPVLDLEREYSFTELSAEEICSEGGKEYVAGAIARSLFERHPELSAKDEPSRNFWVASLSHGGLVEPSSVWMALFTKFEEYFEIIHPENEVDRRSNVVIRLKELLKERHPDVPQKIISFYAKVRTYIRIKHINKREENKKFVSQDRWRSVCRIDDDEEEADYDVLTTNGEELLSRLANNF